jgi:hypothetical protein
MIFDSPKERAELERQYRMRIEELFGKGKVTLGRKEAAKVKGIPFGTIAGRRHLSPRGGNPDHYTGRKAEWKVKSVIDWCFIDHRNMRKYLKENGYTDEEINEINKNSKRCKIL